VVESSALNILMTYLCGSSVSVLENIMVEKEELASSVSYWWDSRPNTTIWFQPTGVATEKLEFVEKRLHELLKEVASKPLDMIYMRECVNREARLIKFQAESSEQFYSNNIITNYLFGRRDGSTLTQLGTLREYEVLSQWTEEQWKAFLTKWLIDVHHISTLGKPSMALATKLKQAEEDRIAKRKEELGSEGLKKLGERVEAAKAKNDVVIPGSLIDQWPVPGVGSIHFIESSTARSGKARDVGLSNNAAQEVIDAAKPGLPLFIQFEDVPTNFVTISVHIGTSQVPVELKPLLSIFVDNFFNTPINRDGKLVNFEDVVMELEKDTISYSLGGGSKIYDPESMLISFQLDPEKYTTIIEWVRTLMFDSVFDISRIKACVSKALADIPEAKRDGRAMSLEVDWAVHIRKEWFPMTKRTLVRAVYLRRLKKLVQKEPQKVLDMFEQLRRLLFSFHNVRVLVISDIAKLSKFSEPVQSWDALTKSFGSDSTGKDMLPIIKTYTMLNEEGQSPGNTGAVIIPMTTLDTSYSVSTGKGLTSYEDPRIPAMLVAIAYLEAVEGPLWNAVRGSGLAYGTHFSREMDWGFLQYRVYRSPDSSKAIDTSRETVAKIASGEVPLDKHLVEGAVSSIVSNFADEQATMPYAAQQNYILGVVRGLDPAWTKKILAQVRNVTGEEIKEVMSELILPVFQPGKSNVVVTCAPIMQEVSSRVTCTLLTSFVHI
jgi:Zn-dependent M16 (insulinase) family peptidase